MGAQTIIAALALVLSVVSLAWQAVTGFASQQSARTIWQWEYASTIIAWLQEPGLPHDGQVLIPGCVKNTGERPVRDLSVRWYLGRSPITEVRKLDPCFMPGAKAEFSSSIAAEHLAALHKRRLNAVVQFRTVGDDWWRTGTDGGLISSTYKVSSDSDWAAGHDPWPAATLSSK